MHGTVNVTTNSESVSLQCSNQDLWSLHPLLETWSPMPVWFGYHVHKLTLAEPAAELYLYKWKNHFFEPSRGFSTVGFWRSWSLPGLTYAEGWRVGKYVPILHVWPSYSSIRYNSLYGFLAGDDISICSTIRYLSSTFQGWCHFSASHFSYEPVLRVWNVTMKQPHVVAQSRNVM